MDEYRVNPLDYINLPDNDMPVINPENGLPKKSYMLFLCERIVRGGMHEVELSNRVIRAFHVMYSKVHVPVVRPKFTHWNLEAMKVGEHQFVKRVNVVAARQAAYRAGVNNPGTRFSVRKPNPDHHGKDFCADNFMIIRIQ